LLPTKVPELTLQLLPLVATKGARLPDVKESETNGVDGYKLPVDTVGDDDGGGAASSAVSPPDHKMRLKPNPILDAHIHRRECIDCPSFLRSSTLLRDGHPSCQIPLV
jgi:hypothetical protein